MIFSKIYDIADILLWSFRENCSKIKFEFIYKFYFIYIIKFVTKYRIIEEDNFIERNYYVFIT